MKKILYFIQWQWRRLETWQRFWLLAMFLIGAGFGSNGLYSMYLLGAGSVIILGFMLKWAVYDGIKNSWAKYNEEQDQIVNILKDTK